MSLSLANGNLPNAYAASHVVEAATVKFTNESRIIKYCYLFQVLGLKMCSSAFLVRFHILFVSSSLRPKVSVIKCIAFPTVFEDGVQHGSDCGSIPLLQGVILLVPILMGIAFALVVGETAFYITQEADHIYRLLKIIKKGLVTDKQLNSPKIDF